MRKSSTDFKSVKQDIKNYFGILEVKAI